MILLCFCPCICLYFFVILYFTNGPITLLSSTLFFYKFLSSSSPAFPCIFLFFISFTHSGCLNPQYISFSLLHRCISGCVSVQSHRLFNILHLQSSPIAILLNRTSSTYLLRLSNSIILIVRSPFNFLFPVLPICFNANKVFFAGCCLWSSLLLMFLHHILKYLHA